MSQIRLLFLGQKPIAEACYNILQNLNLKEEITLCGVVSNSARNVWWRSNSIYQIRPSTMHFIDNDKKNEEEILWLIKTKKVNTIVSVQHPWILSSEILDKVKGNAYNLHLAKLPEYRGFNSFTHAILN